MVSVHKRAGITWLQHFTSPHSDFQSNEAILLYIWVGYFHDLSPTSKIWGCNPESTKVPTGGHGLWCSHFWGWKYGYEDAILDSL